jgi:hypothetical protein
VSEFLAEQKDAKENAKDGSQESEGGELAHRIAMYQLEPDEIA